MAGTDDTTSTLHQTGSCLCGSVRFLVDGAILFNELCHCRACGRARGMTPVHLIGVEGDFKILQGEGQMRMIQGMGALTHAICSNCGVGLYQQPKGKTFYATYPTTFQIETSNSNEQDASSHNVPCSFLPPHLQPKFHNNYENRLTNYYDSLPKYKTFKSKGILMTNDGDVMVRKEESP